MAVTGYNRRTLLSAIAATPIVIAAPAVASAAEPSRHGAWLVEYERLYNEVTAWSDANPDHEFDEGIQAYDAVNKVELRIVNTPPANAAEAKDKLRFAMLVNKQGIPLDGDDAATLIDEVGRFLL